MMTLFLNDGPRFLLETLFEWVAASKRTHVSLFPDRDHSFLTKNLGADEEERKDGGSSSRPCVFQNLCEMPKTPSIIGLMSNRRH